PRLIVSTSIHSLKLLQSPHHALLTSDSFSPLVLSTLAASHLRRVQPRHEGTRATEAPPSLAAKVAASTGEMMAALLGDEGTVVSSLLGGGGVGNWQGRLLQRRGSAKKVREGNG
ncbi:hypothetical protein Droror1_Dr00027761, partial [Drosera rotundifolia]